MKRQITLRTCCLFLLMLFLITVSIDSLLSQDQTSPPSSGQPEMKEDGTDQHQNQSLFKKLESDIRDWVLRHPLLTIIWGISAPVLVFIFRDLIKKIIMDGIKPLFARLLARILILLGRYVTPLKQYQKTLQRQLKEGGLTKQLIGEGVDLERNYISIQISKEEYIDPETVHSFDPADAVREEGRARTGMKMLKKERIEVNEVLNNAEDYGNRIAIIGGPGSGKTTLMQHLAYECAKNEDIKQIPVLVTLTDYVESEAGDLRSYLPTIFKDNAFPEAQDYLEAQLKAGRLIILLDGFDEVEIGKRKDTREQIEAFANNARYLQNRFVVTSRPIREAFFDNFRHHKVMPLLPEQRRAFLESKVDDSPDSEFDSRNCAELVDAIEGHVGIRRLASNPLLLTFMYYIHKYNLALPRSRAELYRQSVNLMLDWDVKTGRPNHIKVRGWDAKKEVLKNVAYYYHISQINKLSQEELIEQVDKYLPDSLKESFTAEALIEEIENSSGAVQHIATEAYQFIHLTFQEYLTADYINDNWDKESPKLMQNLGDSWWREVAFLLAGIMGNATPLISCILSYREEIVDESERLSYLSIVLMCLYEAQIDDVVSEQVFGALSKVPYDQAADVVESIFGLLEEIGKEFDTLLRNILSSPDRSVRDWGQGFLHQYLSKLSYDQAADVVRSIFGSLEEMSRELVSFLVNMTSSPDESVRNCGQGFLSRCSVIGQDGASMVVIPAGEFQMGSDNGGDHEKPVHTVYLDTFYMDKYEVTNAQYRRFVQATRYSEPAGYGYVGDAWRDGFRPCSDSRFRGDDQPVVCVCWADAQAYAAWAGKRLPTEAEWEKAARGGLVGMEYPWGSKITEENANYGSNTVNTTPVGSYPPNGYGLYDMAGNVWEWCADWYSSDYYSGPPERNPKGPDSGTVRVLRGGSWIYNPYYLRVAPRSYNPPTDAYSHIGFRCVSQD